MGSNKQVWLEPQTHLPDLLRIRTESAEKAQTPN